MDQVYRIGRRLGKLALALLMVVSLFDLTSLFANDETNAPAKVIQLCDEENIQSTEDGELLIPWSSTIETTDENMLLYNDYESTMQDNLYATPDTFNLQVIDHTGGKQIELVNGTDYELYYTNPSDGLFTMNKDDAKQFSHFKIMFTDKTKTFSNMVIKYDTHAKIADIKENEQERKFLNEASFKIETNYWITETATYTYTNPNYKPIENSMNAQENVNAIYAPREFNWEDDIVKIKASVTQRDIPDNVIMKAERVTESADKENNIITEILDQTNGLKFYYQVTFTSNDEIVAIDQSKIKFESSVKPKVAPISDDIEMDESRETTKAPLKSTLSAVNASNYEVWWQDEHNDDWNHDGQGFKYGDFGEDTSYDMFYILGHYNAFTSGEYYGTHVVGPVIAGGNSAVQPGGSTTDAMYAHDVPSYFGGSVGFNTINTYSTVPVFIGTNVSNQKGYYLNGIDPNTGKGRVYENYYFTDSYVDFDTAFRKINSQLTQYANSNYEGIDAVGNKIKSIVITNDYKDISETGKTTKNLNKTYYFEKNNNLDDIGLRIKLGYNYIISADILNEVKYIVYDYSDFAEATTKTTFINIVGGNDETVVSLPQIYKALNDELGKSEGITQHGDIKAAYQFKSIEVERAFNIAWFIQNAKEVNTKKGGKLVGHLVAPNSLVDLTGGDYNGSVIAKNIHANGCEGHMWPFKLDTAINFNKTVNDKKPEAGESFTFTLENVQRPQGANEIPIVEAKSDVSGYVSFPIKDLTAIGNYIYKISEKDAGLGYVKNDEVYYAKVTVTAEGTAKVIPKFEGFYNNYSNGNVSEPIGKDLTINNIRQLSVEKKWEKEDGRPLDSEGMDPIEFTLVQQYKEDSGYKVTFNFYTTLATGITKNIGTYTTKSLKKDGKYQLGIETTSNFVRYSNYKATGDSNVDINIGEMVEGIWHRNIEISVNDIKSDTTIDVYFLDSTNALNNDFYVIKNNENLSGNQDSYVDVNKLIKGERDYNDSNKYTLGNNNVWYMIFNDLPATGEVNGKNCKFTYKIKESAVPGYDVHYENNNGVLAGIITMTNKAKNNDLEVRKVSSTGNTSALENAEFAMYKYKENDLMEKDKLKFKVKDENDANQRNYVFSNDGTEVKLVTNKNGLLSLSNMPKGDYILEETKAPDGFVIDNQYIFIHIDYIASKSYYAIGKNKPDTDSSKVYFKDDNVDTDTSNTIKYKFTVENTPDIKVPETGGTPDNRYQKIGFLLACTGLAMYAIYEVKRKKNKEKSTN